MLLTADNQDGILLSVINNGLVMMYGHVANIPNNNGKTITTPLAMNHYAHYVATPVWTGAYTNHVAIAYKDATHLQFLNYRSYSNSTYNLDCMWICVC